MRVLVTGSTGFIGDWVARRLAAGGAEVHALVRPPTHRHKIPGVNVIPGDLSRPERLGFLDGLPDPDVVCHLAADTRMDVPPEVSQVNVDGTRNLVTALGERLRGKRFIFASSIAAVDRAKKPRGPLTEEDSPAPRSPYAVSKLACEELLEAEARARGFHLGILRLATIYGPGQEQGGLVTLAQAAREGGLAARLPWPGRISFCHVRDVAEVFSALAEREEPAEGTWFVSEERGHTMAEAAAILRRVQGGGKGPLPVPRFPLKMVNAMLWLPGLRRFAPWSLRAALADTILCDSAALTRLLDLEWTSLKDGLEETFG